MSRVECFLIEPTDRASVFLRRYSSAESGFDCASGYHNAKTPIGVRALDPAVTEHHALIDRSKPPRSDPRWPTKCEACGYAFADSDAWQIFYEVIYVRRDTGAEMHLRDAPPGALWDCTWWPDKGPDGHHWCLKLPPGGGCDEWQIDGPANNGGGWTRSGIAPRLTARPSILTPRYHGFLTDGVLESC